MSLSVATIARDHQSFINTQLEQVERELHPSVQEDEELIRRALFAVRNKSVQFERFIPAYQTLHTIVQDVRLTEVTVNFDYERITCSCPQKDWCRHKVSVLLSLYQYYDSVQDWVSNWRQKKSVQLHLLASERTPENWLAMVNEVMSHLLQPGRPVPTDGFLLSNIAENAFTKLKKHMPFEREWQPIYKLFMEIGVFNKIWEHLNRTNTPVTTNYFEYFFDKTLNKIQDNMHEISGGSRLFATDPFFDLLQNMVRELLLERHGQFSRRMNLYLSFWDSVFVEKKRAEKELSILTSLMDQPDENPNLSEDVPLHLVMNLFYIIVKDYESLRESLQKVNIEILDVYFGLAKLSFSQHNEEAGEIILKSVLPYLKEFIHEHLKPTHRQMYVRRASLIYDNIILTEQEELMLYSAFGTYGIQPYSNYLLKTKRFDEWAALHQLYPSSISYLESCGLKDVLDEAPQVTLPLYHYYALQEVDQKSRLNYKQAVRIWKMMKSAAKKSGRMNFWEDYIFTIREQYKRLRALQEELEKGNLLA
ncbi:SWIM zinc finger family protein [Ureibacillus composti]